MGLQRWLCLPIQEERLSAGESRRVRAGAGGPLRIQGAGVPLVTASQTAGWGALERSLALVGGPPGWRSGDLKVRASILRSCLLMF